MRNDQGFPIVLRNEREFKKEDLIEIATIENEYIVKNTYLKQNTVYRAIE